ncbi:MAG: BamA/TamA family outer membrane protein, partial [Bacteroidota bacterium]
MRRIIYVITLLLLSFNTASAQSLFMKYFNHVLNDTSEQAKPKLIAYPTFAYSPETSWEIGLSAILVYKARQDTNNRLSEIQSFSFATFESQWGSWLEHALYTHENKYFFLGVVKYQNFPLSYYGIGPEATSEVNANVEASEFRFRERILRKVKGNWYTGPEVDFELMRNVNFDWVSDELTLSTPRGAEGFTDLSLGWGIVYDDRHNVLNVRHGSFVELAWLTSQDAWGSDFNFNSYYADFRFYRPIKKKNVLAVQAFGQYTTGSPPFNQLALMGGDKLMRGYYTGRYRDNHMAVVQAEYRMLPLPFAKRWGFNVFAGTGKVF